jgi:protein-S-isoprenylcysteine O-methyltransferase Ste14
MNVIGKTTIHPVFFYSGKILGYIVWIHFFILSFPFTDFWHPQFGYINFFSYLSVCLGLVLIVLSLIYLGRSTRLGLPTEKTALKTKGLYQFSRNPMYLGFDLLTIGSILYSVNWMILFAGIYSIVVYHFIILGEEKFLAQRFGADYVAYKDKVRRYF